MSLEGSFVEHCAPTLAGIKVASLFCFFPENKRQFARQMKLWRDWFARHGLRLVVLRGSCEKNSFLLYLYRTQVLTRELERPEIRGFLCSLGYDVSVGCEGLLRQMGQRLRSCQDFPHEIGVFLGYPLEDVQGFIENRGRNYTCCGCWKSYGDPDQARRRFSSYRACTAAYKRRYADGIGVERLTVAV